MDRSASTRAEYAPEHQAFVITASMADSHLASCPERWQFRGRSPAASRPRPPQQISLPVD
jgi:hypothetical protein